MVGRFGSGCTDENVQVGGGANLHILDPRIAALDGDGAVIVGVDECVIVVVHAITVGVNRSGGTRDADRVKERTAPTSIEANELKFVRRAACRERKGMRYPCEVRFDGGGWGKYVWEEEPTFEIDLQGLGCNVVTISRTLRVAGSGKHHVTFGLKRSAPLPDAARQASPRVRQYVGMTTTKPTATEGVPFKVVADYEPRGDQPAAIERLAQGVLSGMKHQTLLGVTGSGKTYTVAKVVELVQRPTLVIAPNKTLAAQLAQEYRDFFPDNAVEYFVSYYDYYQPEAYVASSDTYIEKEADINDEIDKLRHAATRSLMTRRDVLIVASVSCIYGLGSPAEYYSFVERITRGERKNRQRLARRLIEMQYQRNDYDLSRGRFRIRGDTLEIMPAYEDVAVRVEFFGDDVERVVELDTLTGEILSERDSIDIYPAKHFVTSKEKLDEGVIEIEQELEERLKELRDAGKLLEAQRLEHRTRYDLEMLRETGYCSGVENYSQPLGRRPRESTPWTLMDYLPDDFLLVLDESHLAVPQLHGMFHGEMARKDSLIDYGFRLPSARDNRPLNFEEVEAHVDQALYVSATPGPYELEHSSQVVQQVIRPTGLLDPTIEVKPTKGQIDDLLEQINARVERGERALITTLTKRMAEELTDYLGEMNVKVHYLHSEVDTLTRTEILRDLRLGIYDVVVGINLLREGLDLPEVSLVAILDADKEGYLRSTPSLIQTMGRAARHIDGRVIMYADVVTDSMRRAIDETSRRRVIQEQFNTANGIEPQGIHKAVRDITDSIRQAAEPRAVYEVRKDLPKDELARVVNGLELEMKQAARELEFEKAALLRDEMTDLKRLMIAQEVVERGATGEIEQRYRESASTGGSRRRGSGQRRRR
jgi:excinuclease ABC subunit B